jgi:hypothetical protein
MTTSRSSFARWRPVRGVVYAVFAFAITAASSPASHTGLPDEVRGTISVHGYDLPADAFRVRARPLHANPIGEAGPPLHCDRSFILQATAIGVDAPGHYQFSIRGLIPGVPYRIGIRLERWGRGRAPRLVWSSDRVPCVLAGEAELRFDAHAVRSEISVLGPANPEQRRRRALWVSADSVDFADPALAARTFRWRTTLPGVTGGRLQVSVKPFPRIAERRRASPYDPCPPDESGIIYTQDFPVAVARPGAWTTIPAVNFNALVGRTGRAGDGAALPGTLGPAALDPNFQTLILPKLEAGMPFYVRVLPLRDGELVCDPEIGGVPPEVVLGLLKKVAEMTSDPKISVENVIYSGPAWSPVEKGRTYFRITKPHTLPNNFLLMSSWEKMALYTGYGPGETIPEGAGFWYKPGSGSSSWVEDFAEGLGAVFTGLVDGIGDLVDYTSKLWEEVQDGVVNAVADSINSLGIIDCDDECRALLETGLEIGLVAMGVPPSLPNFEDLTDQGLEYLADQALSQFAPGVPVPDFVTDYASAQAKNFIKKVAEEMKADYGVAGMPDWLAPDIRFQPAMLTMHLYGRGKTQPFNAQPGLSRLNTPIYGGAFTFLPRHLPEKGIEPPLVFPMVLPANFANLPKMPPTTFKNIAGQTITIPPNPYAAAIWDRDHWLKLRFLPASACYHLHLVALSNPGGVYKVFDVGFRPTDLKPCPH